MSGVYKEIPSSEPQRLGSLEAAADPSHACRTVLQWWMTPAAMDMHVSETDNMHNSRKKLTLNYNNYYTPHDQKPWLHHNGS